MFRLHSDGNKTMERLFDLAETPLRELNQALHDCLPDDATSVWRIVNPKGEHAVACGIDTPAEVQIQGHVGYYCAGMNKQAHVIIHGNAGTGVAENMMSGLVRVKGNASQSAGATGHGGLLIIEGNAAARCGISLKGLHIVVHGSVGHMSGFMAQKGVLVVCGDAGHALGDSIYEAKIFLKGKADELGADCVEKNMAEEHLTFLAALLETAEVNEDPASFRRYGSARSLYNFDIDDADAFS